MATITLPPQIAPATVGRIPRLQNGDRLTAEEFERRYNAMPDLKKAELIHGVVYMSPPVGFEEHGGPHFDLISWLGLYRIATPGVRGGDNATLRLPLANRPQPDAFLIVLPSHGGRVQIDANGYIVGGPELTAEVAASNASYDLHDKRDLYLQAGIQEYVVWVVQQQAIQWFVLENGQYGLLEPSADGIYRSKVLPGLWMDPAALIAGNMQRVAQVAQEGLASPEYGFFLQKLRQTVIQ